MGCRIMIGTADGIADSACFYDSVTMIAFGPIFHGGESGSGWKEAEMFSDYLRKECGVKDPREILVGDLMHCYGKFVKKYSDEQGNRTYQIKEEEGK